MFTKGPPLYLFTSVSKEMIRQSTKTIPFPFLFKRVGSKDKTLTVVNDMEEGNMHTHTTSSTLTLHKLNLK